MNRDAIQCQHQLSQLALSVTDTAPCILVVEDDDSLRDLVVWLLTSERGFRVIDAPNSQVALSLLDECSSLPNLLLFDYQLPCMSGLELYDLLHVRPGWEAIPGMMVSANLPQQAVKDRKMIGLEKPFDLDQLLQAIDDVLAEQVGTNLPIWEYCLH